MSSCAIPQAPEPADFPMPNSIHVSLHANEEAGDDFSTWPQAVQNLHSREMTRWQERNPTLQAIDIRQFVIGGLRICVTEFHAAPKVPA